MTEEEQVEHFLLAQKTAAGNADWTETSRSSAWTIEWPLIVSGESTGGRLMIKSPFSISPQEFKILLIFLERCIARLEFKPYGEHMNPLKGLPRKIPKGRIKGPHVHLWENNKRYCENGKLPDELHIAMPLKEDLIDFNSCLRWFCMKHRIGIDVSKVPNIPSEPLLL